MPDLHYEHPRLAAIYDLGNGWSEDRDFYLRLAGEGQKRILDLGCGTGVLSHAYAALGHVVTGVDPCLPMLDVARRGANGDRICWIRSFAEAFRSDTRFDLIVMTGHAFQVLLDDADIAATLAMMRDHLADDGRIVFETRNPAVDWGGRWDGGVRDYVSEGITIRETRAVISKEADRLRFETRYDFPDEALVSVSELRFLSREDMESRLALAGLCAEQVLGDWRGGPFDPATSDEMIFVIRRA